MSTTAPAVHFSGKILSPQDVEVSIKELRTLVLGNETLGRFRTDDEYLLRFLYCMEFNVFLAYKRLEKYTNGIIKYPTWFALDSDCPLERKRVLEKNEMIILPDRDKSGRSIFITKLGKIVITNSSPSEKARMVDVWMESIMDDRMTQASGVSGILDMQNYSWKLFKWLTPNVIIAGASKMDNYPFTDLVLHVVNTSFLLNASLALIWPFLSDRIKNTFKFHYSNWPSLHEYISPDVLPPEYGGTGQNLNYKRSIQILFDNNEKIKSNLKYHRCAK